MSPEGQAEPGGSGAPHGHVAIGRGAHGERTHAALHGLTGKIRPRRWAEGGDQAVEGGVEERGQTHQEAECAEGIWEEKQIARPYPPPCDLYGARLNNLKNDRAGGGHHENRQKIQIHRISAPHTFRR